MKIPHALWPRLMPLLDEALDQPADAREAWLAAQVLDDALRQALQQLLAERAELDQGAFMAAGPRWSEPAASLPAMQRDAERGVVQSGLFAGDMLGPYRLIRPLGQGGMSVVWLAERDDGQLRRQVAIKMPHAGPGQALLAERLKRERDILASLQHRHIARLYDVGTTPLGLPYLVLEYIEGQSLPDYCDARQLTVHARLRLFLQVLDAVQHAHTQLVLHRDLKPSNILVDAQGEVKLLDFGIAKLIRDSETGAAPSTELTQHSGHVLTPDYAAPEQIAGAPLTTASDVYALGVILFELLTGQRPYRLPRGTRGALEEAILATDPRRPSQVWLDAEVQTHHPTAVTLSDLAAHFHATPRRLHQLLKGDLDVIVGTALQKQAARRYATAEAFAQDIRHHLAKEPIAAQPDSRWYRTRKYVQRHAWALSAVGAIVMALSVGLGAALWQAQQARQEAAKANAIKDFLVGLFENGDVEQPDALRKRQQTVEQLLVSSAHALGAQLQDQPRVRAELQGVVGGLLHNLAITDEAIKLRQQRVAQLEALGAPVGERAQALRELADSLDARGETVQARQRLDEGLALCRQVAMAPAQACYGLQVARGQMAVIAKDLALATRLIEPALDSLRSSHAHSEQMAEALVAHGDLLGLKGDTERSFQAYEAAMTVRAALWGGQSVRLARERYALATGLAQVGRIGQAYMEMRLAYETMASALGSEHRNTAMAELQMGLLQTYVGERPGGWQHVVHAAELLLRQRDQLDLRAVYDAYSFRAEAALYDGRLSEVAAPLAEAERLLSQLQAAVPDNGQIAMAKAWYLDDAGQSHAARTLLQATRERLVRTLGPAHPYIRDFDEAIASTYLSEGDLQGAANVLQAMRLAGRQDLSQSTAWSAWLLASGRYQEAEPLVRQRYDRLKSLPRSSQYRSALFTAADQMGRLYMGLGQPQKACMYFDEAVQTLKTAYEGNPYLIAARGRYGQALLAAGRRDEARKQASLAQAHAPRLAPHFRKPVEALWPALSAP